MILNFNQPFYSRFKKTNQLIKKYSSLDIEKKLVNDELSDMEEMGDEINNLLYMHPFHRQIIIKGGTFISHSKNSPFIVSLRNIDKYQSEFDKINFAIINSQDFFQFMKFNSKANMSYCSSTNVLSFESGENSDSSFFQTEPITKQRINAFLTEDDKKLFLGGKEGWKLLCKLSEENSYNLIEDYKFGNKLEVGFIRGSDQYEVIGPSKLRHEYDAFIDIHTKFMPKLEENDNVNIYILERPNCSIKIVIITLKNKQREMTIRFQVMC